MSWGSAWVLGLGLVGVGVLLGGGSVAEGEAGEVGQGVGAALFGGAFVAQGQRRLPVGVGPGGGGGAGGGEGVDDVAEQGAGGGVEGEPADQHAVGVGGHVQGAAFVGAGVAAVGVQDGLQVAGDPA